MISLLKKTLMLLFVMLGAVLVVHTLMYLIPGDPAAMMAGEYASEETIQSIRREMSLDQPFLSRYASYAASIARLDFGNSIYSGKPVSSLIMERFPATLSLAALAMAIAASLGVAAGVVAAVWRGSAADRLILWSSSIFISTPVFVTCVLLTLVFSHWLGLLPPSGKQGPNPAFFILPATALASRSIALIVRVVKNELVDVLSRNYIKAARSLGFAESRIVLVFALKNIIAPVLTIVLLDFGAYLGGAVVTETIFAWPGIGRLMIMALQKRDMPLVQGIIIFGTFLFILIGALIDALQAWTSSRTGE